MTGRSKVWVCCRSFDGIAGSNLVRGMDARLLGVLCELSDTGLCDAQITHPLELYRLCYIRV